MLTGQESECVITYICLVQIKLDARTNSFVQPKPTHTHGTKKVLIVECFIGIVCVQFGVCYGDMLQSSGRCANPKHCVVFLLLSY